MSKTIDFSKGASGALIIKVNGGIPRSLSNPNDLIVKPNPEATGAIMKLSDESWRQTVFLTDTVTEATVAKSPFTDLTALVAYLNTYIGE